MAQTPSNMIALGTIAPKFELLDTISNSKMKLDNLKGSKGTVIAFVCNHCPFVVHINEQFVKIANQYGIKKNQIIAIGDGANDINMFKESGLSISMHGKPVLDDLVTWSVKKNYYKTILDLFIFLEKE